MGDTCAPTGIELELSVIAGRIRDVLCTHKDWIRGARQSSIPVLPKEKANYRWLRDLTDKVPVS